MEGIRQRPKPNRGIRSGGVSGVLNPHQSPLANQLIEPTFSSGRTVPNMLRIS